MVLHALLFYFIGLGCQKVVLHFLIDKLHKAEPERKDFLEISVLWIDNRYRNAILQSNI